MKRGYWGTVEDVEMFDGDGEDGVELVKDCLRLAESLLILIFYFDYFLNAEIDSNLI